MSKAPRINGRTCRPYVQAKKPFTNSNGQLYGKWETPDLYVVYSYGPHWPLFVYDHTLGAWYENGDRCSSTTSRHHSYANPYVNTWSGSCGWLRGLVAARIGEHTQMQRIGRTFGLAA